MPSAVWRTACGMFALLLTAALVGGRPAHAQGLLRLDFEGPEPSWRDGGGDARYSIELHQRVAGAAQTGDWCEHVRLAAGNGTYVYLRQAIGAARVISELRPSVWVKANRAGVQVLARVVLPRTIDAGTGQPLTTYLRGGSYTAVGSWQQLRFEPLPQLLERQAILLRTRVGRVETPEAYVDSILLNIYGGPGATEIWIDDLEIAGFVGNPQPTPLPIASQPSPSAAVPRNMPVAWSPASARERDHLASKVEMDGPVLLVEGKPFFPRMVQHRGEPLAFLRGLGFNSVKLDSPASMALLAEAQREGLWLVSPPPDGIATLTASAAANWSPLLAWDLGEGLTNLELESVRQMADRLRALEKPLVRPVTADVESELLAYSKHIDLLRASRFPLWSSLELPDYGLWLRERPKLARPGTTLWTTIQTQPLPGHAEQLALLTNQPSQGNLPSEQIRLVTFSAVAAGARGLCFQSQSRLDAEDPATRERAANLELLNLELDLIEPWCAGGSLVAYADVNNPEIRGAVLQTAHAQLLLPLWVGRHAQFVPGQSAGNGIVFTVPGVPQSSDAFELTPLELRSVKSLRKTGGTRVTLEEFGLNSMVLFTNDPLVISSIKRKTESSGRRAVELARELAAARLSSTEVIARQLAVATPPLPEVATRLSEASAALAKSETYMKANAYQLPAAWREVQRGLRPLRLLERAHWDRAVAAIGSPMGVASATSFATLPKFWDFMRRLQTTELSLNALPAGDFEDLSRMTQSGWRHFTHPQYDIQTEAQVTPTGPHAGRFSLQLRAWQADAKAPPGLVDTPPIWVQSPAVLVEQGALVRIHGWVQVPAPIIGSVDGLMIFDSMTGPPLAERIGETKGWQEFTLYRVTPQSGSLVLTLALTGQGVARIDDVTIEQVQQRSAASAAPGAQEAFIRRLPPVR
jgi:hypothetical protein